MGSSCSVCVYVYVFIYHLTNLPNNSFTATCLNQDEHDLLGTVDELRTNSLAMFSYGRGPVRLGRPARTCIHKLCKDTRCRPEDLSGATDNRNRWREWESKNSVLSARLDDADIWISKNPLRETQSMRFYCFIFFFAPSVRAYIYIYIYIYIYWFGFILKKKQDDRKLCIISTWLKH